jgi:hypothetical protein
VQVHHIAPFHYISSPHIQRGDLEFNPQNLIPLCQGPGTNNHHELIGHLGDFQYFNQNVKADMIGLWKDMIPSLLEQQPDWIARHQNHYPLVNAMSAQNITDFIALLVIWTEAASERRRINRAVVWTETASQWQCRYSQSEYKCSNTQYKWRLS